VKLTSGLFALISLLSISPVHANDTFATLGAGGLIPTKTNQIAMESEDLNISVHEITIHYVFRNTTDKDVDLLLAFPLPDLSGRVVYNSPLNLPNEARPNFVEFSATANRKPIATAMEVRAFHGDTDITARLKSIGLSGTVLLTPLNRELLKVRGVERKRLELQELIIPGEFNPGLPGIGNQGWWATWTMRVKFSWKQHFPANRTVELVQSYRPVVGGSYIVAGDDGKWSIERYCGTPPILKRIAEIQKRHPVPNDDVALWERTIDYILTTAKNWQGPIGSFHLVVTTDSADDTLATCMPDLRQVNPTRYEFHATDFVPSQELKLLILQPARAR
jgi:Domain of unknown function (DUF4424)